MAALGDEGLALLEEASVACQKVTANLKKRKQRCLRTLANRLSWPCILVVVYIYCHGPGPACALRYAANWGLARHPSAPNCEVTVADVESWVLRAFMSETYIAAEANADTHIAFTAQKFMAEYATYEWMLAQNLKGVGVPSGELLHLYVASFGPLPHSQRVQAHLNQLQGQKSRSRWMTAFRGRWHVDYRNLKTRLHRAPSTVSSQVPPPDILSAHLILK